MRDQSPIDRIRIASPLTAAALLAAVWLAGCGKELAEAPANPVAGVWRAVLASPGGDLPFTIRIAETGAWPPAVMVNGEEELPFSALTQESGAVELQIGHYDSRIVVLLSEDGQTMNGEWSKTAAGGGISKLPIALTRGSEERFVTGRTTVLTAESHPEIDGEWYAQFGEPGEGEVALARFERVGDGSDYKGTFMTPTGDYRYLAGDYINGVLRLSCFDGGHVFLFHARALADGTLEGDFWSRDSYHTTWTARRPAEGEASPLPDPYQLASITNPEMRFRFSFPDTAGETVTQDDERFKGKVVLVNIFGTWCPNCNDEAPLLAEWDRRYRDRGLAIVGLAYEFSGDFRRSAAMASRFIEKYGIEYPILIAGTSDKRAAAATLPDLDAVVSYPTSIFIGRDGKVRKVHSGFSGPATGEHHERLKADFIQTIEELLGEPAAGR